MRISLNSSHNRIGLWFIFINYRKNCRLSCVIFQAVHHSSSLIILFRKQATGFSANIWETRKFREIFAYQELRFRFQFIIRARIDSAMQLMSTYWYQSWRIPFSFSVLIRQKLIILIFCGANILLHSFIQTF